MNIRKRILLFVLISAAISCLLFAAQIIYYQINQSQCQQCGRCTLHCPVGAIQFDEQNGGLYINQDLCTACGACLENCPFGAIEVITGNSEDILSKPELKLSCNPNPMKSYTNFRISLPKGIRQAELIIVNTKGQSVHVKKINQTDYTFRWNGTDIHGKYLPGGVYFAALICGTVKITSKITLVR